MRLLLLVLATACLFTQASHAQSRTLDPGSRDGTFLASIARAEVYESGLRESFELVGLQLVQDGDWVYLTGELRRPGGAAVSEAYCDGDAFVGILFRRSGSRWLVADGAGAETTYCQTDMTDFDLLAQQFDLRAQQTGAPRSVFSMVADDSFADSLGMGEATMRDVSPMVEGPSMDGVFTLLSADNGDVACYLEMRGPEGEVSFYAEFDLCFDRGAVVGRRYRLVAEPAQVLGDSCDGDPFCSETKTVMLVTRLVPVRR